MRAEDYWERRYRRGGDSGAGSRSGSAKAKAAWINELIRREKVGSVADWGCGDGGQLAMMKMPRDYIGFDVSATAIRRCLERFPKAQFAHVHPSGPDPFTVHTELALSLDVLFHLPDDEAYETHLRRLFTSASRLVVIHSTDYDAPQRGHHLRRRRFTPDVAHYYGGLWQLHYRPAHPRTGGFHLYRKVRPDDS